MPLKSSLPGYVLLATAATVLGAATLAQRTPAPDDRAKAAAGNIQGTAYHFKAQLENYAPPFEAQVKTLLEGARAQPRGEGLFLMTDASITRYTTNGLLTVRAMTPRCFFDVTTYTVSSTGLLEIVRPGTNGFQVTGEGFSFNTNSVLYLSNRVVTVIPGPKESASRL